jgi:hypothetical protein
VKDKRSSGEFVYHVVYLLMLKMNIMLSIIYYVSCVAAIQMVLLQSAGERVVRADLQLLQVVSGVT